MITSHKTLRLRSDKRTPKEKAAEIALGLTQAIVHHLCLGASIIAR